jgi:hypothetical protein
VFYPNALFIDGKVAPIEKAFGRTDEQPNVVFLKTNTVDEERRNSIAAWLTNNQDSGDCVWIAGSRWGERGTPPFLVMNDGAACWSQYAFDNVELAEAFSVDFSDILVTTRDYDYTRFDEPSTDVFLGGSLWERTDKKGVKSQYYRAEGDMWFSDSPYSIIKDRLGLDIEPGKVRNLLSWAGGRSLGIFYYLSTVADGQGAEITNEIANFILGPLAGSMKERDIGYVKRSTVLHETALIELGRAMALNLVPSSARKELYPLLIKRYNTEFFELLAVTMGTVEEAARLAFYNILAEVLEPIFSQAGGDEINAMIKAVLDANPTQAALVAAKDQKVIGWAMGQVMNAAKPTKLDPATVRAAILKYQG